jgi:ketosteroid isomerase-like protein
MSPIGLVARSKGHRLLSKAFLLVPEDFENFTINIRRILPSDDAVVVEARYQATSAKASGKPLDAQVTHIWDFVDGKITRFQQYTDTWQCKHSGGRSGGQLGPGWSTRDPGGVR